MRIAISLLVLAPAALAAAAPAAPRAQPPTAAQPGTARPAVPATPVVPAGPPVQLLAIDLTTVPQACRAQVKQAQAPVLAVALAARIALARCMADQAIAPLSLCDCGESIVAIDAATAPAIAILDDVIANGDEATRLLAEHAQGQLYTGLVTRMVATLPRPGPGATDAEFALRDIRSQTLEAQLAPWREAALAAYQNAFDIGKANTRLASNPAVASALRDSQQQLAAGVATRPAAAPAPQDPG